MSEDLIIGTQDDIGFRQSDVRVTHRTGGKNRSSVVDVNGRLTRFRYDKDIWGRILITSKSFSPVAASLNLYSFRTEEPALQLLKKGLDDRQKQEKNIPTGGLQENDGEFDGIGWSEPYWTRKI